MFCQTYQCYRTKGPKLKFCLFTVLYLALVVLQTPVQCQHDFPPQIFSPEPVAGSYLKEGNDPKLLLCKAGSQPLAEYGWLKDDQLITSFNVNLSVLQLGPPITRAMAGYYRCQARNSLGAIISNAAHVEVAYMGQFGQPEPDELAITGQTTQPVVIPLPDLVSNPLPSITWYQNGGPLDDEGYRYHVTLNRSLILLDRKLADSGAMYKAIAINPHASTPQMMADGPTFAVSITGSDSGDLRPPEIVVPPVDKRVSPGEINKVYFECVFNARRVEDVHIQWFRVAGAGRTRIVEDENKYIFSRWTNRTLTIKNPVKADEGDYECEASLTIQGQRRTASATAKLTVDVRPAISNQFPSDYSRDYGQSLTIPCEATGSPPPTVHWLFNAQDLTQLGDSRYSVHSNGSLTIQLIDLEHAGVYQCFIRNIAGEASRATWLKVSSSPPMLITPPSNLTIIEGSDARFPCEVRGAPKPTLEWTKVLSTGEQVITSDGRYQILDRGELLIATVIPADSGLYRCNASNSRGVVAAEASLSVFVRTQINRPPSDQIVRKGLPAVFQCGVSHDPEIQVFWKWLLQGDGESGFSELVITPERHILYDNGTLVIRHVDIVDVGNYKCQVTSAGGDDSRTVSLDYVELPQPPVITRVALHVSNVRAAVVHWTLAYDGNTPILKYNIQYTVVNAADNAGTWQTFGTDLPPGTNQATVTGLKPALQYQFRIYATNRVGESRPSTPQPVPGLVMPQQPPSKPPRFLWGVPFSNSSVKLWWQAPDQDYWNGPLKGYVIRYTLFGYENDNSSFQSVVVDDVSVLLNPTYELKGLSIFQEYMIQIAAFNANGTGVYSSLVSVTTMEGHPTRPPRNFSVTAVNSTAIRAEWLSPSPRFINGINLGYKLEARRVNNTDTETVVVQNTGSSPFDVQVAHLTKLLKFTEYEVTVLCYTSAGNGPRTLPVTMRTQEDVPGEVGSLKFTDIRDISVKVIWSRPTEVNGILTGYTVKYVKKNTTEAAVPIELSNTTLSHTVFPLRPTTKYTISVFASTRKGPGPALSADIESGVPPELPTAPYDLRVPRPEIQARSVLVRFIPGYDGKTSITQWIVEALEGDSTVWKEIKKHSDPSAQSVLVDNLHPYTDYQLRLIAENIVGRSNYSVPTETFQTMQAAPGVPPGNVTVRALNATALRVSWTPLSRKAWNGIPRGYKIHYWNSSSTIFKEIDLSNGMNMDSYIIPQLEEWMVYHVKMLAYNDVGSSHFSPVTDERTREAVPSAGPESVQVFATSSTSINVTWGEVPQVDRNGMILGYKVQYQSREEDIAAVFKDVVGNMTVSTIVQNLRKFVQYEVRVLAYTRMGDGILSLPEKSVRTDEDVPGPPVIIWFPEVTYTMAKIVWEAPLEPNGIISGYMVSYQLKDSGQQWINSTDLTASTRTYTVGNLQREAFYDFLVTAKTRLGWGLGSSVVVYTMINRRPPDSPSQPSINPSQIQARAVTISWMPAAFNGYGPLRNFTVQYQSDIQGWTSVIEAIGPEVTSYTVRGLRPNTPYVFRVAATNDIGTSAFSVQSPEAKTREDAPEGPPQNVVVTPLTTTSVNVSWEPASRSSWNSEFILYQIGFREYYPMEGSWDEAKPESNQTSHILESLSKQVTYEVRVQVINDYGIGPWSTSVFQAIELAPTAPPISITTEGTSSTEILVTWQPPPPDTLNGALSGYILLYWATIDTESAAKKIIVVEQQTLLQDLEIYMEYSVVVQAYNLAGEGPRSAVYTQMTLEGVPGQPREMSFWNITYTSLDVVWLPPARPNGVIRSYELSYEEVSDSVGTKQVKFSIPGSQTQWHIDNLQENVTYMFSIRAETSLGQGNETVKSVKTGPQPGSPETPSKPTIVLDNVENTVILSWRPCSPGCKVVLGYIIQTRTIKPDTDWMFTSQINGRQTSIEMELNPDTIYQFRVIAFNKYGISRSSAPSDEFVTPGTAEEQKKIPFHKETWFQVIVGLGGLVIILVIGLLLCHVSRRSKRKKVPSSAPSRTNLTATPAEPEEGGFGNIEMTRQSRRQPLPFAGIRTGSAKSSSIYARSPPRPSPASVAYSDDDTASAAKPPLPDDDSQSSCTEKPSDIDSTEPSDQESDEDSYDGPLPPPPPSSPPPPPFSVSIRNTYINEPVQNSWQPQPNSSFNAYQYTDSEAESSHYALSLNGGHVMMNNTAGSRAPLPGFSSFV